MPSHTPFTALRAFGQVAEHLSFTRAAQALHVTQSAVSQQVARLEQRLGKRLVERTGRRLRLTAHGEALAAACQQSFALLDSAVRRIAGDSGANGVYFKVPPTFAMKWLMPRLPRFQVQHPHIAPFRNVLSTGKRYFLVCPPSRRHAPAVARFLSWVQAELRMR